MKGQTGCRPIKITLYSQVMKHHFPSRSIVLAIHLPPRLLWSEMEFICIISVRNCNHGDKRRQTQRRRMDGGTLFVFVFCVCVRGRWGGWEWGEDCTPTQPQMIHQIQLESFVTPLMPDWPAVSHWTTNLSLRCYRLSFTSQTQASSIWTMHLMFHLPQWPLVYCHTGGRKVQKHI